MYGESIIQRALRDGFNVFQINRDFAAQMQFLLASDIEVVARRGWDVTATGIIVVGGTEAREPVASSNLYAHRFRACAATQAVHDMAPAFTEQWCQIHESRADPEYRPHPPEVFQARREQREAAMLRRLKTHCDECGFLLSGGHSPDCHINCRPSRLGEKKNLPDPPCPVYVPEAEEEQAEPNPWNPPIPRHLYGLLAEVYAAQPLEVEVESTRSIRDVIRDLERMCPVGQLEALPRFDPDLARHAFTYGGVGRSPLVDIIPYQGRESWALVSTTARAP